MEGIILGLDSNNSQGAIKGTDGNRYYFNIEEWKGQFEIRQNMRVDFEVNDGRAIGIFPLGQLANLTSCTNAPKSKFTAAILAFCLGGIGIHKFYLGSWGWGLIHLFFFWTWIPAIVSFIEFIRYLTLTDDEFSEKSAQLDGPFSFLW
ncbi:TM2 domain-containing protein [Thalassotalea aquiviva]|uniref:TM2 domain-containing protein n=1 Tax=Thalassotalea aquiviva TaxID=3242415 RepID=UPI00352BCD33